MEEQAPPLLQQTKKKRPATGPLDDPVKKRQVRQFQIIGLEPQHVQWTAGQDVGVKALDVVRRYLRSHLTPDVAEGMDEETFQRRSDQLAKWENEHFIVVVLDASEDNTNLAVYSFYTTQVILRTTTPQVEGEQVKTYYGFTRVNRINRHSSNRPAGNVTTIPELLESKLFKSQWDAMKKSMQNEHAAEETVVEEKEHSVAARKKAVRSYFSAGRNWTKRRRR